MVARLPPATSGVVAEAPLFQQQWQVSVLQGKGKPPGHCWDFPSSLNQLEPSQHLPELTGTGLEGDWSWRHPSVEDMDVRADVALKESIVTAQTGAKVIVEEVQEVGRVVMRT